MTYNELIKACNTEEIAIRCSSEHELRHARQLLHEITGVQIGKTPVNCIFYPYAVIWCNEICGWTGDGADHPERITYSEFLGISGVVNFAPQEEEILNLEELL